MQRCGSPSAFAVNPALLALATLGLPVPVTAQHEHRSPYAGHEELEISSLSPDQLRELRAGEGMGQARPAELNHYPGPKHALEMATELGLSTRQVEALTDTRRGMLGHAIATGEDIIEAERDLTELFRQGRPDEAAVQERAVALGVKYGELRAIHLVPHLETAELLSDSRLIYTTH